MSLGLLRSDYMVHSLQDCAFKQVELNTIASSFGGISSQLLSMHRYEVGLVWEANNWCSLFVLNLHNYRTPM